VTPATQTLGAALDDIYYAAFTGQVLVMLPKLQARGLQLDSASTAPATSALPAPVIA
jgi:hypothetical protein